MPTYVYKFIDSGETIEVHQAFTDDALTEASHPSDGEMRPVKKVFTPVGITFKGGGFYKNDSATGSKTGASSNSGSSANSTVTATSTESTSTTTTGSEKTAIKPETKTDKKTETKASPAKSE